MPSFACFKRMLWRPPRNLKLLNQVRPRLTLKKSIAILPVSYPWIPISVIINTPVVGGQAGFGSTKQKFRKKEMSGILNCAQHF